MGKQLPQELCIDGYKIVQASNHHVHIFRLDDGRCVFHCQHNKELDFVGLMEMLKFYKKMSERPIL